jgi:tetratricopeptide (TPR) repeat protein
VARDALERRRADWRTKILPLVNTVKRIFRLAFLFLSGAFALRAAGAEPPTVFRYFPQAATNAITADFNAAFAAAHKNFSGALAATFSAKRLDDKIISSESFTNFLGDYAAQHPDFPPAFDLAAAWARGGNGADIQTQLLARLQQMLRRPVWDETLPDGFALGEKIRLVNVARADDAPAVAVAEKKGKITAATNLTGVVRLRMLFRHTFDKADTQFAVALGGFLRPNCALDTETTRLVREHIAREKKNPAPAALMVTPLPPPAVAQTAPVSRAENPNLFLWLALVVVFIVSIAAVVFAWRARSVPAVAPAAATTARLEPAGTLVPQVSQAVRDALVQELAATRLELFKAQQIASARVVSANGYESRAHGTPPDRAGSAVAGLLAEGQTFADAGELAKAVKCFDAALAIQPDSTDALLKLGGVLDRLGRVDEALGCFDRAIAADDSQPVAYLLKGGLFNRLARHEEASKCYEQALLKQRKPAA